MSKKNLMVNSGVPLHVNYKEDLTAKRNSAVDSWYIVCNFEYEGMQAGFEWHQMEVRIGEARLTNTEFLLMDGTQKIWCDNGQTGLVSESHGSSDKELNIFSEFGALRGDCEKMSLKLESQRGKVDVALRPRGDVLYNGATGLLRILGTGSYQYSFPNMDAEGTVIIDGKKYIVSNATAWFDRQWTFDKTEGLIEKDKAKQTWLWLGMTLNDDASGAISLWDTYSNNCRNAFATILNKNGTQINAVADITYDNIWTSSRTGSRYPGKIHISLPTEELDITLTALLDEPEFVHNEGVTFGCQSLCSVMGSYKGNPVNRHVIVEIIGNLLGE
jgi:predicted secreted hydrolase